jgi:hypothetical protein
MVGRLALALAQGACPPAHRVTCFFQWAGVKGGSYFYAREAGMKRLAVLVCLLPALGAATAGSAAADPSNAKASCEGILVSSATYPGEVADLGRYYHDLLKAAGLPPGLLDVGAAQLKAGSVDACLVALPS